MDAISYSYADKAQKRIKKFIENPDSTSGVVTVPTTIAAGETITIPAGRMAVLPDLQIDGDLVVDGEVFIPNGTSLSKVVEKVSSTDNAIVRFDGTAGAVQNSTVTVDDNGNVGIGGTPSAWYSGFRALQGGSGIFMITSGGQGMYLMSNAYYNTGGFPTYTTTNPVSMYEQVSGTHTWYKAPSGTAGNAITWTNAMTLDTSGNLTVGGNSTMSVINAKYDASNYIYTQARNTADTTEVFINLIGGVKRSAILANGTFQSATNSYGSTSDAKLKENVVDTTPKLEKLMQVQVRNFNYIGQEDKQIGVIAQEIEEIFPSLVFETKDTKQVEVNKERVIPAVEELKDDHGNVIQEAKPETIEKYIETETQETGEVTKNVKYSIIYMMMLKGMQEMRAEYTSEIEALQSRIEILEGAK